MAEASAARPVTVGRLARNLKRGRSNVRVKLLRKPAKRLQRLHRRGKLRRLTLTVRTKLRDGGGLSTTEAARVELRR